MIRLRGAADDDLELIMAWRSNPLVYQGFYQQEEPLRFEEHYLWWRTRENFKIWVARYGEGRYERDVGVVTVQYLDTPCPEIGYYIGEVTLWGKGVATETVRQACEWLKEQGYKFVDTAIKKDNFASIRLAEKLSFECMGDARRGELAFRKELKAES